MAFYNAQKKLSKTPTQQLTTKIAILTLPRKNETCSFLTLILGHSKITKQNPGKAHSPIHQKCPIVHRNEHLISILTHANMIS